MSKLLREEGSVYKYFILTFATGFGSGYFPFASGTAGTLFAGIPVFLLFSLLSTGWYVGATVIVMITGVFFCEAADRVLGEKDSSKIVIDEVAGFLVTMAFVPVNFYTVAAGFFLFRFFDVVKYFPAKWAEDRLPGGAGVLFDDVFAGIYANICLQIGILIIKVLF